MRADSTEYVQVPITASDGLPLDSDSFAMAFVLDPLAVVPGGGWHAATYQDGVVACLVGPANGGLVLTPAHYYVLVRVTDNPSVPVVCAPGRLRIEAVA